MRKIIITKFKTILKEVIDMDEQRIVERTRQVLVSIGFPDPADCNKNDDNGLRMYAQDSFKKIPRLKACLSHASKFAEDKLLWTARAEDGRPEFIITNEEDNVAIVIECKKDESLQISDVLKSKNILQKNSNIISKYAADGALHYAWFLSHRYDVIAIGVSGKINMDDAKGTDIVADTYFWQYRKEHLESEPGPFIKINLKELLSYEQYKDIIRQIKENRMEETA